MLVTQSNDLRSFLNNYSKSNNGDVDLDKLVLKYRSTGSLEDFCLICNKTLGIIIYYAKRVSNPYFTEADCYSYGLQALNRAIEQWNTGSKKSSFQTFFNAKIHNYFFTLERKTKLYKNLNNNESSLDSLEEALGNNLYDILPYEGFRLKRNLTLDCPFEPSSVHYKILQTLETYNITKKSDLKNILGLTSSELNRAIKTMKQKLNYLV